jgi:hypothetical protein
MHTKSWIKGLLWVCALNAGAVAMAPSAFGQGANAGARSNADASAQQVDLAGVASILRQLQAQVQQLNDQVKSLKAEQESARSESAVLRKELDATKTQLMAFSGQPAGVSEPVAAAVAPSVSTTEERINKLEENQQLADQKIAEQNQTKVESGSKYRLRLSGIVLFNMFENRGTVENQDFPQLATPGYALSSDGSFGGSLRQSQIEIQGFGPTIAGARTSADVQFDFAGGFPDAPNGVTFGLMRLRTGTVRFDWDKTSVIAGQDTLFIAPMAPTSIATLAVPAMAYAGNLWAWTPQVRVEHHFTLSDNSSLLLQAGILDSLTGDLPPAEYYRYPSWGESSGQPAYATRLAWTKEIHGQNMTLGAGGYYGRQDWGFGRSVDGWAGTLDFSLPLAKNFAFSSQFYRGRAIGGLGGGIGQTVVWNGSLLDPTTQVVGLNSIGGWAQLKYRATTKLEFNGAFGIDNPFAGDLREYGGSQTYYDSPLSRNQSALVNFLYQPRSDIVFSLEYRRLKTFTLDSSANTGNIINFSVGYIF